MAAKNYTTRSNPADIAEGDTCRHTYDKETQTKVSRSTVKFTDPGSTGRPIGGQTITLGQWKKMQEGVDEALAEASARAENDRGRGYTIDDSPETMARNAADFGMSKPEILGGDDDGSVSDD